MIFGATLALGSCSKKGKTLEEVKEAGKLVIATSPDFPPFETLDGEEVVGIEVEIMKLICQELGVTPEFVQIDFDSVLLGVQSTKYDCGMSGISVTEKRKQNMLFTDAYCLAAQCIVVPADSNISSKADLDGKKVSVQTGTTAEEFCMGAGYDVSAFQANADALTAMTEGRVQAWVVDDLTAAEMVKGNSDVKILDDKMTTEPYAFAFAFGSEDLVDAINEILADLLADGTIEELFEEFDAPYTAPDED